MRKIPGMERDLSDDFKLSFRSIGEVNEAFTGLVARAAMDRSIRYRGRKKAHRAAVLNAVVLWLDAQPHDRQREVIRGGMDLLNVLLAGESDAGQDEVAGEVGSPIEGPPKSGRRKSQ